MSAIVISTLPTKLCHWSGLSYTEFVYSNLFLSKTLLTFEDSLEVNLKSSTQDCLGLRLYGFTSA